jgi:hypothetical protein
MDPRLFSPLAWSLGVMVLIGLLAFAIVVVRRKTVADEEDSAATGPTPGRADWVGLLTRLQGAGLPDKQWPALAMDLTAQIQACPPALRAPLQAALDGAIARCRDPLTAAAMTQVRRALAALPAA